MTDTAYAFDTSETQRSVAPCSYAIADRIRALETAVSTGEVAYPPAMDLSLEVKRVEQALRG